MYACTIHLYLSAQSFGLYGFYPAYIGALAVFSEQQGQRGQLALGHLRRAGERRLLSLIEYYIMQGAQVQLKYQGNINFMKLCSKSKNNSPELAIVDALRVSLLTFELEGPKPGSPRLKL